MYLTNFISILANPLSVQPVKILPTAVTADGQSDFDLRGEAGTNGGSVGDQTKTRCSLYTTQQKLAWIFGPHTS